MKKIITFLICSIAFFETFAQNTQAPIIVTDASGNGSVIVGSIEEAIEKVPSLGFIYLPSGTVKGLKNGNTTDAIRISKTVNIRGAGIDPKASNLTGVSLITNPIVFIVASISVGTISSSKSTIEGVILGSIYFSATTDNPVEDITITRCNIDLLTFSGRAISKLTVHNCQVQSMALGTVDNTLVSSNFTLTNSFVKNISSSNNGRNQEPMYLGKNIRIENCILYHTGNMIQPNPSYGEGFLMEQGIYKNNIVIITNLPATLSPSVGALQIMSNNFFTTDLLQPIDNRITNNQYKALKSEDIFVDWANKDYHLKPTFAYRFAGENNTEVGIFGGSQPGRDGFIPSTPYIYFKEISIKPDASGNIQVKIKVKSPD
jgi:hypothetical protein